MEIYWLI